LHLSELGEHTPVHAPMAWSQANGHADPAFCHAPVASQAWGCRPLHCFEPLVHAAQLPALQTAAHGEPVFCHCPVASHVCG
jgi:hypothetical protein